MVASEAVPLAKTGGLADVVGALSRELVRLGHDVKLVLPRYKDFGDLVKDLTEIRTIQVPATPMPLEVTIETGVTAGERVVTDGQLRVVPGARVDPKPQKTS